MRIGILIKDFDQLRNWQMRIIVSIKESKEDELILLIKDGRLADPVNESIFQKLRKFFKKKNLIGKFLFYSHMRLEEKLFYKRHTTVNKPEVIAFLKTITEIQLSPTRKGFLDIFSTEDAQQVKEHDLDVILRFEFNIIRGDILTASKYGIWSFHHGDNAINRGGPAGFWEISLKQPVVGVTLQQLTPELDGGLVIDKAYYNRHWAFAKTNIMVTENSVNLLLKNLRKLNRGEYNPTKSLVYYNELYVAPSFWVVIKYLLHYYKNFFGRFIDRVLMALGRRSYCWTLFIGKGNFMNKTLFRIKPAELPKDEFWADPFLFKHQNETYVFFENYSYKTELGKISCGRLEGTKIVDVVEIMNFDYHLSFPYVFESKGEIFMMPETRQNKRLEIYKCLEFPTKWELHKTAFEGERVVDAFFYKDSTDQHWLFLNKQDNVNTTADCELYIYKVDSPELNTIQPHTQNPVIIDARVARNGGCMFSHEGKTYRPSQSNTHAIYGRALNINEVEKLTIDEYIENTIVTVEPNFRKGLERMHHLHQIDDMFVFDAAYKKK